MADTSATTPDRTHKGWLKPAVAIIGVVLGAFLAWRFGAFDVLTVEKIDQ